MIEMTRAAAKGAGTGTAESLPSMAATEAPEEAQACRDPVASAEVSGAAATESKVTAGQGAKSRELADETDKAPVKEAPAVTEQLDMQP